MKKRILIFTVLAVLAIGCNDDESTSTAITANDAKVSTQIDEVADDVSIIAEDQFNMQNGQGRNATASMLPDCAEVTTVVTATTWTRTIAFSADGCEMPNGNVLSGNIIISGSVNYDVPSYTITYTFDNFHHNNKLIEGTGTLVRTLESTAANATIHPVVHHDVNFTVTLPNGSVHTRVGSRVREMIEGFQTPMIWQDNVFQVTGTWTTTFPNGTQTATIGTPLRIEMSCPHIVSGTITMVRNNNTGVLDYGNGDCDNTATVTINGVTTEIILGN